MTAGFSCPFQVYAITHQENCSRGEGLRCTWYILIRPQVGEVVLEMHSSLQQIGPNSCIQMHTPGKP